MPTVDERGWYPPIDCGELAAVADGQTEQVKVRYLCVRYDAVCVQHIANAEVVSPELVPAMRAEAAEQVEDYAGITGSVCIARMAGDPNESVLRQRTSSPGVSRRYEPSMRQVVMHVEGVGEGQQDVDIQ